MLAFDAVQKHLKLFLFTHIVAVFNRYRIKMRILRMPHNEMKTNRIHTGYLSVATTTTTIQRIHVYIGIL